MPLSPPKNLKPLYDFTIDCKACQAKLTASQGDLSDERKKTAALTHRTRRRFAHRSRGSAWRRIGRAGQVFLSAQRYIAAKAAHYTS